MPRQWFAILLAALILSHRIYINQVLNCALFKTMEINCNPGIYEQNEFFCCLPGAPKDL